MLTLPLALRLEKNKLVSTAPWLVLLDLTLAGGSHLRLVRNTENITFGGYVYSAFAFEIGEAKSGGDGRIQGIQLRVANPQRFLQPYLEAEEGLIASPVTLTVVHAGNLAEDHAELQLSWTVLAAKATEEWVVFSLGEQNPMRRRFPLLVSAPNTCNWVFKGAECAYAGEATACARTLEACRELANAPRFGGRPGISGAPRFAA